METIVLVLMILVCFSFMLKQSFRKLLSVGVIALVAALFSGLMWPVAIEQSRSQIEAWLANPQLMLDTSVVLSVEVALQMAFCIMAVNIQTEGHIKRWRLTVYKLLRWFPGVLIFPVLFSALVYAVFSFPGYSFPAVAWSLAAAVLIIIPAGSWLIRKTLPEKEIRLELLFIANALIGIFGIVATVNGRTAVEGIAEVHWGALAGIAGMTLGGLISGWIYYLLKNRYINNRQIKG